MMKDVDLTKGSKELYEGEELLGNIKIDGETIKKTVEKEDEDSVDEE